MYNLCMKLSKDARTDRMITQFESGLTLEQIGKKNGGLTRQRVQQILAEAGVDRYQGGGYLAFKTRRKQQEDHHAAKRLSARRIRISKNYHCTLEEYDRIMQSKPYKIGCIAYKYFQHRKAAQDRGIQFDLTFPEWYNAWESSGHLEQRGRGRGQYVMARIGYKGAYTLGNIKIVTCSENITEGYRHRGYKVKTAEERRISRN